MRREILAEIDFGADSAERDQSLARYFLRTSAFNDFVNDEVDLVVGVKGSGKSAIFRMLVDHSIATSTLKDVDIIPAFNLRGALPIARLAETGNFAKDFEFRKAWKAFVAGGFANHVASKYPTSDKVESLIESLGVLGLRPSTPEPKELWRLLISGPEIVFRPADQTRSERDEADLDDLLAESSAVLAEVGRSAWLVFDRLDESFGPDPEVEAAALRSLLQVMRDVNSLGLSVNMKLLARRDIIRRASVDVPLPNMDHVRTQTLEWSPSDLRALICERLVNSRGFASRFEFSIEDLTNAETRNRMLACLLPASKHPLPPFPARTSTGIDWAVTATQDGSGLANPRNVLALLRLARTEEARMSADTGDDTLLSPLALLRAWVKLSKLRLDATVAQDPVCGPWVDRLDGSPRDFSSEAELAARLRIGPGVSKSWKDHLLDAGLLKRLRNDRYSIAYLYWPALRVRGATAE